MPDLSGFAKKSDIPNVSGFLTAAALVPLALKTDVTTPDLTPYAKKSDIPPAPDLSGFALKTDIPVVPPMPDLSGVALKTDIPVVPDLSGFARKTDLPNVGGFVTAAALAPLALKSDVTMPDLSGYVRKSELPAPPDLSRFALKSEMPQVPPPVDLSGLVKRTDLPAAPDFSRFALKSDLPQVPTPVDLRDFVKRGELPVAPDLSAFARLADVPQRSDLSNFAQRSELPDLTGVVRVRDLEGQLRERDQTIKRLTDHLKAEETMRASEIARLEGLLRQAVERKPEPPTRPLERDKLEHVFGIGPVLAKRLNKIGITTFAQIARWTDADIDAIEPQLETISGRIRREGWVADSSRLHREKYGQHIDVVAGSKAES